MEGCEALGEQEWERSEEMNSDDLWISVAIGLVTGLIGSFLGPAIQRWAKDRRRR